jgi:hypothetical protein
LIEVITSLIGKGYPTGPIEPHLAEFRAMAADPTSRPRARAAAAKALERITEAIASAP